MCVCVCVCVCAVDETVYQEAADEIVEFESSLAEVSHYCNSVTL